MAPKIGTLVQRNRPLPPQAKLQRSAAACGQQQAHRSIRLGQPLRTAPAERARIVAQSAQYHARESEDACSNADMDGDVSHKALVAVEENSRASPPDP